MEQLPQWIIDLQKQANDMGYGRIHPEFVIANGQVGKVIGNTTTQVKFRANVPDQNGAFLLMVDHVKNGPKDGTMTFSVVKKDGKISQVNMFDTIEQNYPI